MPNSKFIDGSWFIVTKGGAIRSLKPPPPYKVTKTMDLLGKSINNVTAVRLALP